jgi:hypothetical protein
MKLVRNVKAISKLLFVLLLLAALIVGAVLSYLWVMGYYVTLDLVYPKDITVNITDYAFDPQNTSYFNVTIQCPTSYKSKETANITRITVSTEGGLLHDMNGTEPLLPYKFQRKGESQTFKCLWNWANYTGQTIRIIAFVAVGSGPTFEAKTPLVNLRITDVRFNSTISVTYFNMTVQNSPSSVTYVNITGVSIDREPIPPENLSIPLPHALNPDESVALKCMWNWTNYQNKSVTVAVRTLQGYMNYATVMTPLPVTLEITDVDFNLVNTTRFNVTVQNNGVSPTHLNVTRITVAMENQIVQGWTAENGTEVDPHLPCALNKNSSITFVCPWNWTEHRDKNVTIAVHTLQGFTAQYSQVTPAPIILEITNVDFNPLNTASFNVTVRNSEFSIADANITEITVTVDGTSKKINVTGPMLPEVLSRTQSVTFNCTWSWAEFSGKNVTVVVQTQGGYSASYSVLLKALTITDVLFNPLDTDHFVVTVQNPTWLNFTITTINVTVQGMASLNITNVVPSLPRMLTPDTNLTFMCEWYWADGKGKNVTITIVTLEGYTTSRTCKIPLS